MKLYEVSYQVTAVIAAEDYDDAVRVAHESAREIMRETRAQDMNIEIELEIRKPEMLPYDWNLECYPYGQPTEKKVGDYFIKEQDNG